MEWFDPSPIIKDSCKLTDIFGRWPSFPDAEIQSFSLTCGETYLKTPEGKYPILDIRIHLWEMTNEVNTKGFFVLKNHTLTDLRFQNTSEMEISDFFYQNVIMGITFGVELEHTDPSSALRHPACIRVEIDPCYGLYAKFKCQSAEVLSAVSCDEEGKILA
jgi:hypothetical protein